MPVLIQHVASTSNPAGAGFNGNPYSMPFPNPIQAGDALVVAMTYPHGTFSSISDTLEQTWGSPVCTADGGSGAWTAAVWVLPNSLSGLDAINLTLTTSTRPVQFTMSEISNIATTSPVNGTALCTGNSAINGSSVVNPGSLTPNNNNSGGGNVIWNYTALASGSGNGNPTGYTAASGFTQLNGDTAWTSNTSFYDGAEMYLQTTAASVSPTMTIAGNTSDHFNSISVPLKVASAGGTLPTGIYVRSIVNLTDGVPLNGNWNLQAHFTGNLRVLDSSFLSGQWVITKVTDSDGNTWTNPDSNGFFWYTLASAGPAKTTVTIDFASATQEPTTVRIFDVMNATAYDTNAVVGASSACTNQSTLSDYPTITPTHSPGLVIGHLSTHGITTAVTSPSGAIYELVNYTGQEDGDLMNNGDGMGIRYNSNTTTENWNWDISAVADATCLASAVAFH